MVFYAVDFFILDNISSESINIALKTLESKFGRIIYFTSDSGSQLRETIINPTDNKGTPIFSWKSSSRCGPQFQKHNLIESRVATFKKFAHKFFKNKICKSRQLTELILTVACISLNKVPIDSTEKSLIAPYNLLYPSIRVPQHEVFIDLSHTTLKHIFRHSKDTIELIKETYIQVLVSNFQKYLLKKDVINSPKPELKNVVMFNKDGSFFFGIISGIHNDQLQIDCKNVQYVRPRSEVYHITSSK